MRTKSSLLSQSTRTESTAFWFGLSVACLACTLLLFHFTDLDLVIQAYFYDHSGGLWIWDRDEPVTKFLLYDGIKKLLVLTALVILVALIVDRFRPVAGSLRRPLMVIFLSLAIIPATVGALKATTNVPCPRDTVNFDGQLLHVGALDRWPEGTRPAEMQRCFPAGHASGGFALLAFVLLGRNRRERITIALAAMTVGWTMGIYKMAIGDHFLSHTLVTMFISILLISVLHRLVPRQKA